QSRVAGDVPLVSARYRSYLSSGPSGAKSVGPRSEDGHHQPDQGGGSTWPAADASSCTSCGPGPGEVGCAAAALGPISITTASSVSRTGRTLTSLCGIPVHNAKAAA